MIIVNMLTEFVHGLKYFHIYFWYLIVNIFMFDVYLAFFVLLA